MWARRAQEYEQKINSGDLVALSEVVRDLHRSDDQREQSYSERQLYELSLERLVRETFRAGWDKRGGGYGKTGYDFGITAGQWHAGDDRHRRTHAPATLPEVLGS